ncbi:MAG: hypothetical protein ABUR63_02295, partial [Verrucomicrobiota bacterium]
AGLPVKLVGGVPGFLSEANGPTHQAIEDIALMRGIPGMQVFCPADNAELLDGLPAILGSPAPAYIRFNATRSDLRHAPFELGRAERWFVNLSAKEVQMLLEELDGAAPAAITSEPLVVR